MKVLNWKEHKLLILYSLGLIIVLAIVDSGMTASFRSWLGIQIPNLDKVGHFFGMGILAFLFLKAFVNKNLKTHISKFILIIISMIFFVTIEEFRHYYEISWTKQAI